MAVTLASVTSIALESGRAKPGTINRDLVGALHNGQTDQKPPQAGSIYTKAILRLKQCTVQATLKIFQPWIEKLIRQPIETHPGVRTAVAVGIPLTLPVHNKTIDSHVVVTKLKLAATRIGDFITTTHRPISL